MMRRSIFLAVALTVAIGVTAQAQHEPRRSDRGAQHAHHKVARGVKVKVSDDPATRALTVRLGPLDLPARSDHRVVAQAPDFFLSFPFDGWLTAYLPRLVDDAGNALPGRLLHHVGFWNTVRPDFLCPNKEEHIFGAGGEMNDWPALPGFGYAVSKGERIRINTMFHNPTETSHPKTYLEVRMEYKKWSADGPELKSVYPTWFDVQECGNSGYDLTPGKNVTSGEFQLGYTGTLLGVGGHMHDYGRGLVLENTTRKDQMAVLEAKLDTAGRIVAMPIVTFTDRGGYRLSQGEVLKVTATYDNPTGQPLPDGAMGIVVGYFLPDEPGTMAALKRKKGKTN